MASDLDTLLASVKASTGEKKPPPDVSDMISSAYDGSIPVQFNGPAPSLGDVGRSALNLLSRENLGYYTGPHLYDAIEHGGALAGAITPQFGLREGREAGEHIEHGNLSKAAAALGLGTAGAALDMIPGEALVKGILKGFKKTAEHLPDAAMAVGLPGKAADTYKKTLAEQKYAKENDELSSLVSSMKEPQTGKPPAEWSQDELESEFAKLLGKKPSLEQKPLTASDVDAIPVAEYNGPLKGMMKQWAEQEESGFTKPLKGGNSYIGEPTSALHDWHTLSDKNYFDLYGHKKPSTPEGLDPYVYGQHPDKFKEPEPNLNQVPLNAGLSLDDMIEIHGSKAGVQKAHDELQDLYNIEKAKANPDPHYMKMIANELVDYKDALGVKTGGKVGPINQTKGKEIEPEYNPYQQKAGRLHYEDDFIGPPEPRRELPVEEKDSRAKLLGFDEGTYYTGVPTVTTDVQPRSFKDPSRKPEKAVFLSDKPEIAEHYGRTIFPMKVRFGNKREVDWPSAHKEIIGYDSDGYNETVMKRLINDAIESGHDSMIVRGMNDLGGKQDQFLVFNPNQLRSPWANFDPLLQHSSNLVSGVGGAAVGAGAIYNEMLKRRQEGQ